MEPRPFSADEDGCRLARVVRGVSGGQARRVAELFYLSFGAKLAGLVLPQDRESGLELLSKSFCLDAVYAALDPAGRVLGVAFVTGGQSVLCLRREALVAAFGTFGGTWRYVAYRLLTSLTSLTSGRRVHHADVRGLEGFSVSPDCRGQGIGAAMIGQICSDARAEGARAIELNVGDTNPARHLYERSGFRQTRTAAVGPFAKRLGFKRFVYYKLEL